MRFLMTGFGFEAYRFEFKIRGFDSEAHGLLVLIEVNEFSNFHDSPSNVQRTWGCKAFRSYKTAGKAAKFATGLEFTDLWRRV